MPWDIARNPLSAFTTAAVAGGDGKRLYLAYPCDSCTKVADRPCTVRDLTRHPYGKGLTPPLQ